MMFDKFCILEPQIFPGHINFRWNRMHRRHSQAKLILPRAIFRTVDSLGTPEGSPRTSKMRPLSADLFPGTSKSSFYACFSTIFGKPWAENRIFRNLTDSRSSGMGNAQNFAVVISRVVLGPSFFQHFFAFWNPKSSPALLIFDEIACFAATPKRNWFCHGPFSARSIHSLIHSFPNVKYQIPFNIKYPIPNTL